MSQENYITDTQSILLSMLSRMKINSAEDTQRQQPQEHQYTSPTGENLGKFGPVLTPCATNTGEQSPVTSGDVTKPAEHIKWADGGKRNRDLSLKFEVPSLNSSRKSGSSNQDGNSSIVFSKWKRIQIVPMSDAKEEMTLTTICTPESLCMELAGSEEVTNQTYPPQWDINQQNKHSDQGSGALIDTVRVGGTSPLAVSYLGGAGTLNFTELKATCGQGDLIQTQNVISQEQQSMDITHNTNTGSTSMIPEKYSEHYLASDPDLWNKIKWDRSVESARNDNFASASEFWKLDNVPAHDLGMGKKKRKWINGKTLQWAQRIRQSWKERQTTIKKREQGGSCEVREEGKDNWEAQNVKHRSGQVNVSIPTQGMAAFGREFNEFQFKLSPINLSEEIFTNENWSKFSSHKERPSPMKAPSPSDPKVPSWIRQNVHNSEMKMKEDQVDQSGFGTHVNDGNANEAHKAISKVCNSAPSHFEQDQEESKATMRGSLSFDILQPVEVLDNSALMSRVYLNRKRLHLTQEQSTSSEGEEHWMCRDTTGSPLGSSTSEMQRGESQRRDTDVSSCLETAPKKRKMRDPAEDTRHVHFAEVLVTDIPSMPYYEARDVSLPSWIVALKKRSRRRNSRLLQDAFQDV